MATIDPLGNVQAMDGGGFMFVEEVGTTRLWICGWWWIQVCRRGWHNLTLDPSERLAQPGLSFQRAFPFAYGHKLFNGSRLEGSKCNSNFQGSASSMLFLLLTVTSFSTEVGLKVQNAIQISKAQLPACFSFCLWSQAL
jgi:hypothetical protein